MSGSSWPASRSPSTRVASARSPATLRATASRRSPCWTPSMEHGFDAVFGGARRDEEKARAKERVFSLRDEFGQWEPKSQRPELWSLYNGRIRRGPAHARVPHLQLDRDGRLAVHRARAPRGALDLLRPRARRLPPRRHVAGALGLPAPGRGRGSRADGGALPHGRRHDLHRRRVVDRGEREPTSSRRWLPRASPSAARPAPTTPSPRRPWKTASARGISSPWTSCASPPRARWTMARARSSGACCSTPRASSRTSSRPSSAPASGVATTRWTWRC